jgi:hypothetical protein
MLIEECEEISQGLMYVADHCGRMPVFGMHSERPLPRF